MSAANDATATPFWMGDVEPGQLGFPFEIDKRLYRKQTGIEYKRTDAGPLLLDAYRPIETRQRSVPLVVMIHGGGWQRGGRYEMGLTRWAGYLASAGLAVVSIDYRLAPATSYPDSFQDCLDAIDWAVEHASELGADEERIGLWGDSAGGHLVLLTATSQTRSDYPGPRLRSGGARLRCAVAWYPPTDLLALHRLAERATPGESMVRHFVGRDPEEDPARWRAASPIEQAHAGVPPSLILQGTRDLLVPHSQAEGYARRLTELGAPHELHIVEGAVHGFDRVAPGAEARRLIDASRRFLCHHLGLPERPTRD